MKFEKYNPKAVRNYQFHLEVVCGISERRAKAIAENEQLFNALVEGYDGRDDDKHIVYNQESIELLTSVPRIDETVAKRYIEAYANNPFQDVNWNVKKQLDQLADENPNFGLTQNKIYKIAKAVDSLDNPWLAYKSGALDFATTAQVYEMFTKDDQQKRRETLGVWSAEHQLKQNENKNLITIKQSDYILRDDALSDYGVITPFMDGWARTDTLRAYKIVEDTLRSNVGVTVNHHIGEDDLDMSDLFEDQQEAVEKILNQPISFLTGYAGTGKTYVIKKVLEALGYNRFLPNNYAVATAVAGKAVKNFVESVQGIDIKTTTITGVRKVEKYTKLFKEATTIVIDEFSMITLQDLAFLFRINPEARYIFIGDSNQLPAIGLDVLQRLEDEQLLVPIKLTIPKRQGKESGIFQDSMAVIEGNIPKFAIDDSEVFYNTPDHEWTIEEIVARHADADVFLTTSNGARKIINDIKHQQTLSKVDKSEWLNFDGVNYYAEGDKIIVTKNNPDTGLMNGDILDVKRNDGQFVLVSQNEKMVIPFDEESFDWQAHKADLGYAITVHKSQGSTINNVVSILGYSPLASRNILYTALTRAKVKHTLYMPSEAVLQDYLDTKVSYQKIDIDLLDLELLERNEMIEKMNGY